MLLLVASVVSIAAKRLRIPYTLLLVIVGLIISPMHFLPEVHMSPELILLIFLPALLFEASWNLKFDQLRRNLIPIFTLAVIGVVLSVGIVGLILHYGVGVSWQNALLFGAMVSATDPVSVLAIFKKLGLPERLTTILEGESLFNDGTAVVVFRILIGIVMGTTGSSGHIPILGSFREFLVVIFGGIAVGAVTGLILSTLTSYVEDHLLEITLTTIAAYGSFLSAETFHVSPVIAVLITGLVIGNYGRRIGMSPTTQVAVNSFWEYAAFVVNSLVFLLMGLEIRVSPLAGSLVTIAWSVGAMLIARAIAVYGLIFVSNRITLRIPTKWLHVLFWGGLRGSLSLALVLSLPYDMPYRPQLVVMVFGTVLFSLLVQGLTISPLLKWLKLSGQQQKLGEYELIRARISAEKSVLDELNHLRNCGDISEETYEAMRDEHSGMQEDLRKRLEELNPADQEIELAERLHIRKHLIAVKKAHVSTLASDGGLSEENLREMKKQFDEELAAIEQETNSHVVQTPEKTSESGTKIK